MEVVLVTTFSTKASVERTVLWVREKETGSVFPSFVRKDMKSDRMATVFLLVPKTKFTPRQKRNAYVLQTTTQSRECVQNVSWEPDITP